MVLPQMMCGCCGLLPSVSDNVPGSTSVLSLVFYGKSLEVSRVKFTDKISSPLNSFLCVREPTTTVLTS